MQPATASEIQVPRSRFVTVIAWLTIVASVLVLLPLPLVLPALTLLAAEEAVQLRNSVLMLGGACVVQIVMGVGLLQRRNWARLLMVLSLAVVAVWQAIDLATSDGSLPSLPESLGNDPMVSELLVTVSRLMVLMAVTIIIGSAWAIYRFTRADVRREFGVSR